MKPTLCALVLVAGCGGSKPAAPPANAPGGPAPVALAIVFNGQELWAGNDEVETDPNATYKGALHDLERGIDGLKLPPGSTVTVVEYADRAKVVVPWTPADRVHGAMLGDQHAYYKQTGSEMVKGVGVALDALAQSQLARKVLLVVGDGIDTDMDAARTALADDAQRATAAHVTARAVVWKDPVSMADEIVHVLAPAPHVVTSAADLPAAMADAVQSAP